MVSAVTMGVLLTALFSIFFQGTRAWRLSDTRSDLHRAATKLSTRLSSEVQESSFSSLVADVQAVAFITALDTDGAFQMGASGRPLWQAQILYYLDSDSQVRRLRMELPLPVDLAEPITAIDFGSGEKPLTHYLSGGEPMARGVTEFKVESLKFGVLNVTLKLESKVPGRDGTTRWQIDSALAMRN